jgi:hypothetical protein
MMPHDPYPMLQQVMKVHTSKEMLGVDLDDPRVWSRPPVTSPDYYLTVHWGGGPNPAGGPVEEPGLSLTQKMLFQLGRVRSVLRSWLAYHTRPISQGGRGMSTIAYSSWVDSLFGQCGRLRGHRHNGGQWGTVNQITHALVLVMGLGQKASKRAWQTVGLYWFCGGAPRVVGHRFFNDWPETKTTTSCPGDENSRIIADEGYVKALGVLRCRKAGSSHGRRVRAVSLKLTELAFLGGVENRYGKRVEEAVASFQQMYPVHGDPAGVVGFNTWKALAEA